VRCRTDELLWRVQSHIKAGMQRFEDVLHKDTEIIPELQQFLKE
jgi:hypothetical protein